MLIDHWPLLGLRVRTARLELRLPNEEELAELADVAAEGVHEPGDRPFLRPWTHGSPAERARSVVQVHWRRRAEWTPQGWALDLVVFRDGRPVGVQDMWAEDFRTLREVATGSWLGLKHQGQGIGTEMRAAALHLAFAGLGAEYARSASFVHNPAPLAVSRKLGYQPDGITRDILDGQVVVSQRLRLSRADWESRERPEVTISGLESCRWQFGADPR
jgi:RimJ/RimL family protein N-acetyltransferase